MFIMTFIMILRSASRTSPSSLSSSRGFSRWRVLEAVCHTSIWRRLDGAGKYQLFWAKLSKHFPKVGQYLEDAPLVQPPDNSANPWHQLLEKHPEIQEVPFIIPVNTGTSLVQEHAKLEIAVSQVGNIIWLCIFYFTFTL